MRRAHDPSRLRGGRRRRGPHPQQQRGDPGGLRGQSQLAAGDKVELPRLAKGLQHHGTECIAGKRIRRGAKCSLDIGGAHGDEQARIEAKLGKAARRQRTGFHFGKILPHPDQRFARGNPSGDPRKETGRGRALVPLGKHLMHGGKRQPAAQHGIGAPVAERDLVEPVHLAGRLDPLDAAAQGRKRVLACAGHAHRSSESGASSVHRENQKLAQSFMICSNIKLTGATESIGIPAPANS